MAQPVTLAWRTIPNQIAVSEATRLLETDRRQARSFLPADRWHWGYVNSREKRIARIASVERSARHLTLDWSNFTPPSESILRDRLASIDLNEL